MDLSKRDAGDARAVRRRSRASRRSPTTACSPAGWSSAACGSSTSTTTAGTTTATSPAACKTQLRRDRPGVGRARQGPEAARPARRHAGRLGRRVRPHADGRDQRRARPQPRPRPPPAGVHACGWPAAASSRASRYGATDDLGFHVAEDPVHVHDLQATILHLLGPRPHEADVPLPGPRLPADRRARARSCRRSWRERASCNGGRLLATDGAQMHTDRQREASLPLVFKSVSICAPSVATLLRRCFVVCLLVLLSADRVPAVAPAPEAVAVDATTLHGKVMAGYQGWFRCPGDPADLGWIHWSRDGRRIAPETLTFEMWPDMTEYGDGERFPAPGFTHPDGSPAHLFSSANAGPSCGTSSGCATTASTARGSSIPCRSRPAARARPVPVPPARAAATSRTRPRRPGRTWALSYDIAGMPGDRVYDVLTADWKKLVDERRHRRPAIPARGRKAGRAGVGLLPRRAEHRDDAGLGQPPDRLLQAPGPCQAFLVGGGDWDWRQNPDPAWQAVYRRLDAYAPWNVGNYSTRRTASSVPTVAHWAGRQARVRTAAASASGCRSSTPGSVGTTSSASRRAAVDDPPAGRAVPLGAVPRAGRS